ncbi:uncharacterized protein TNCT_362491 [Trichonephila clavata]|uniref:Uncharacterized protein n=1 Tax=Trichonephila clavata TaxID=2740835 RepID=A0A8X6K7D2_TRICU|nr:uncharacterized protein TNCT_362491 [Trichonephila clavata]
MIMVPFCAISNFSPSPWIVDYRKRFILETAVCQTVKAYQQRIQKSTTMILLPILILSLSAVSSVIAFKGYDDDFLNFNLKADTCIGQSGDQELCDKYIGCDKKAPKQINDVFKKCVRENVSGGTIGKCNDKESLFKTPEEFDNYKKCLLDTIPMKSDLSNKELKQLCNYKKCIKKVAGQCFEDQGMEN